MRAGAKGDGAEEVTTTKLFYVLRTALRHREAFRAKTGKRSSTAITTMIDGIGTDIDNDSMQ